MKVFVFGPSGSGKTYVSKALKATGINAFDADKIEGLNAWYNRDGDEVHEPETADEAFANGYSFLWSKKAMERFIGQFDEVYVFGGSGNVGSVFDLFDKVYFLKVNAELQRHRILSSTRPTPGMDKNDDGIVIWGDWFEEVALQQNIPFIDASLTPEEIFSIISK